MLRHRRNRSTSRRRFGTAVVEVALIIPLLLFVTIGTIEICELVYLQQSLKIAAYEGARIAIVPDANEYDITTQVGEIAAVRQLVDPVVDIKPANFADLEMGEFITVSVSVDTSSKCYFSNLVTKSVQTESVVMMKEN